MIHKFHVDDSSRVIATDENGGMLKSQTVEALLLLEILWALERLANWEESKWESQH